MNSKESTLQEFVFIGKGGGNKSDLDTRYPQLSIKGESEVT